MICWAGGGCILWVVQFINKKNAAKAFNAMVITFAFAAMCHLMLVAFVAVAKQDMGYLNPLDFLGISILFPTYRESRMVAGIGWLALALLFLTILYIRIHYHVYVAIIRESKVGRRFSKTTKDLRKKVFEKIS